MIVPTPDRCHSLLDRRVKMLFIGKCGGGPAIGDDEGGIGGEERSVKRLIGDYEKSVHVSFNVHSDHHGIGVIKQFTQIGNRHVCIARWSILNLAYARRLAGQKW